MRNRRRAARDPTATGASGLESTPRSTLRGRRKDRKEKAFGHRALFAVPARKNPTQRAARELRAPRFELAGDAGTVQRERRRLGGRGRSDSMQLCMTAYVDGVFVSTLMICRKVRVLN